VRNRNPLFFAQLAFTLLVCAFLIVPVVLSMLAGLTVNYLVGIHSGLTLRWVGEVWAGYRDTIFLSIGIALACLGCTLVLGIPTAYVLARRQTPLARALEELLVMPVAVPGLATALALIITYGGAGGFRTSWTFILVGHVLFTLPFMVRSVLAVLMAIDLIYLPSSVTTPVTAGAIVAWAADRWLKARAAKAGIAKSGPEFEAYAELPRRRAGRLADGGDAVDGRVQHDVAAAHAVQQDAAGRACRCLCVAAAGDCQRLYAGVLPDDRAAAAAHAGAVASARGEVPQRRGVTAIPDGAKPIAITLERCAKTFADGTRAVEPLDLAIDAGETVVFLGPSGCGKTTTLRIIAGLEAPDAGGKVLFDGTDVTPLPIEKRNVGMVFQSYALFPNMSVRHRPKAEVAQRVAEMLAMMRIEALADRSIDQLSGGQRQRVALARALAVQPRALLLDEPLTALDAKLRDSLRLEIDQLLRRLRITAIYVTHDQAEAMALGDRIVVMEHGRVAQVGRPRDIYQRPATRFVAEFIGTMNRLGGSVRDGAFVTAAGAIPWPDAPTAASEVLFRPEDVTLAAGTPHLTGTVDAAFFLGDRTRLFVQVGEGKPLVVETSARRDFQHGEAVGLDVDPRGLMAL